MQDIGQPVKIIDMEFKDRIKAARKFAGLSQVQLAERIGMTQATVSELETGKSTKTSFIARIATECGVNPLWLETGAGDMTVDRASMLKTETNAEFIGMMDPWGSDTSLDEDEVEVPMFREVELAGGYGHTQVIVAPDRKWRFSRALLHDAGVEPECAACVVIRGRNMERLIMSGSHIGIDTSMVRIMDGEIYAFDHDGLLRVSYLYRLPGGGIRIRSENDQEFPDEVLPSGDVPSIRILGQVFWWSTIRRARGG